MRVRILLVAVAVAFASASCTQGPPRTPTYNMAPEYCPYDSKMVQFNGDSIGAGFAHAVSLPEEYSKFEAAQGAATWTIDVQVPLISTRVKQWIEQCGKPGVVVIQGGIIDLTRGVALDQLQGVITELSGWLEARDIPTIWLAIHPMPSVSNYQVINPARIEYNAWLTGPGAVWGTAIDCTEAMQDPAVPGTLNLAFWDPVDIFGTPDGLHPNAAGYEVMAACVEPTILDVLGSQ
jgi:lysophospholipase L1-like esterase